MLLFSVLGTESYIWKFSLSLKQVHGRKYFIIMDNQLLVGRMLNKMFFFRLLIYCEDFSSDQVIKICCQRQGAKILQDLDDRCFCPYTIISVFKKFCFIKDTHSSSSEVPINIKKCDVCFQFST